MKVGLSYDLKEAMAGALTQKTEDALEEYDSPETVEAIASVVRVQGHLAVKLGGGRAFLNRVLTEDVDFVFNIAEGRGSYRSREAQVPSVLEMLDVPYSGSDPQCLAICLDKPLTKKLAAMAGVTTPRHIVFTSLTQLEDVAKADVPFPVFLKPAWEGSSKGVRVTSRVDSFDGLAAGLARLIEGYRQPVMAEEFIPGDEVTVGLVGNPPQVLGIMRIVPRSPDPAFVYSLEVKRDWERLVEYECPARLPQDVLDRIARSSLDAFEALGCRDFARMDFRVKDGVPYFLEVNPLPGLNPHSGDLPIMARLMGWTYDSLVGAILRAACSRYQRCSVE